MDTLLIILVSLCLLAAIIIIILLLTGPTRHQNVVNNSDESLQKIVQAMQNTLLSFNTNILNSLSNNRLTTTKDIHDYQESINFKLQEQFKLLNETVEKRLEMINTKVEDRLTKGFEKNNATFQSISDRMAIIDQAQANITKLSTEVVGLQDVLTNNQARGAFGEQQLYQILYAAYGENPKIYKTQYTLKKGKGEQRDVKPDVAIFMPEPHNVLCIDSKFPFSAYSKLFDKQESVEEAEIMKSFKKEVVNHIDTVANKYIIPNKTADYAIMFVPSDGILALIHSKCQDLVERAQNKNVLIVSPTTIFPLLQTYKMVYIDHERNLNVKQITEQIALLNKDFTKLDSEWGTINKGITSLYHNSDTFDQRVNRITNKFKKIKVADMSSEMIENKGDESDV